MDLKDLSMYLTGLLRSEPEVITAFFMGTLITGMLGFWLRHRLFSSYDARIELARRETDLVRKEAHIAAVEAKLAIVESRLSEEEKPVVTYRRQGLVLLHSGEPPLIERLAAMEVSCAGLSAENLRLLRDKQRAEADAADLRARLAQARAEADHWAKWAKVHEANAQLLEAGSLKED